MRRRTPSRHTACITVTLSYEYKRHRNLRKRGIQEAIETWGRSQCIILALCVHTGRGLYDLIKHYVMGGSGSMRDSTAESWLLTRDDDGATASRPP